MATHAGLVQPDAALRAERYSLRSARIGSTRAIEAGIPRPEHLAAGDRPIHLWPMPDVSKPPLHTLPHAELMAKLDALTNLRVVADPTSSTGWKLEVGPFPGWKDVPAW